MLKQKTFRAEEFDLLELTKELDRLVNNWMSKFPDITIKEMRISKPMREHTEPNDSSSDDYCDNKYIYTLIETIIFEE